MRPVQAALLSVVLLLMCGVIWWMTRLDGSTPRTAAPLSMEDQARAADSDSVGDLQAPSAPTRTELPTDERDTRAEIAAEATADQPAADIPEIRGGRVLDSLGQPVSGAKVYFGAQDSGFGDAISLDVLYRSGSTWGGAVLEVETDAQGRYTIDTSKKWNPARVAVRSPGHAPYSGELRLPARGEDYPDLLLQTSAFLEGRVFDHLDRPVEGARIESLPPRSGGLVVDFGELDRDGAEGKQSGWRTDASGRFLIDEVAAGPYRLRVSHPDAPPEEVGGSTSSPGERVTGIEVRLGEGAEIRGVVVGIPEGEAVKYVVVAQPSETDFGGFGLRGSRSQVLSADGSFRLRGLRKGTPVRLALHLDGDERGFWGEGLARAVQAMPGDLSVQMQFTGATGVRLRALDAVTGEPVEEFEFEAGGWWTERLADTDGAPIEKHPDGVVEHSGFNTRDDGSFDVVLRADGYEPFERKGLTVDSGKVLDLGEVRLKTAPMLIVEVVDHATGAPVESARVKMLIRSDEDGELEMPWSWGDEGSAKTDDRGLARLSSRPGRAVRFSVTHRHYADHYGEPIVLADVPDQQYEVRLMRGGTVQIQVLDSSGEPLARRSVSHRSSHATPDEHFVSDAQGKKSDRQGKLSFERLPAGDHYFRVSKQKSNQGNVFVSFTDSTSVAELSDDWKVVTVVEGGEHSLTLHAPPSASLRGRLLENGRPLVGASLSIAPRDDGDEEEATDFAYPGILGGDSGAKTDGEGRFEFEDEGIGPMRLTIDHPQRAMPALYDLVLELGPNEVEIDLDVTVLRGRVTDEDGKPVVSADISARRKDGSDRRNREVFMISTSGGAMITHGSALGDPVLTDADGRFELRGVAAGTALVVEVDAKDAMLEDDSLEVSPLTPREERVLETLRLVRAGSLRVAISAEGGGTLSFCNVRLDPTGVEGDAKAQYEFLQGAGEVRFTGLLPGEWTVVATSTDPRDGSELAGETRVVTIEAGVEARAELVLR